jgi:polar amino acid transport system substrate-binding protein
MKHAMGRAVASLSPLVLLLAGCTSILPSTPLRVGVTPDYEPLVFLRGGQLVGAEVDFARALGQELGRRVEFVTVDWEEQLEALKSGHTDIIMTGMSITPERSRQVAFSEPYLGNALYALVRRSDLARWPSAAAVRDEARVIGVLADTTGETYVREQVPAARRVVVPSSAEAPALLKRGAIEAFVDDGWSVALLLSQDPDQLALAKGALQVEDLAWGVRLSDRQLLAQVNNVLERWREDGTLLAIVRRWAPHIDLLE